MDNLLSFLSQIILWMINSYGYAGILLAMVIESACIPLPSEIIMTFAGFLVSEGTFSLAGVTLAGAAGNLIGSWIAYFLGRFGGRGFLERYGKYFFISEAELKKADRWFLKYGEATVFVTRMLHLVRTFISLPAGISKMNFFRFSIYSFVGSIPWCLGLAYVGKVLGNHLRQLGPYFHQFDFIVVIGLVLFIFWFKKMYNMKDTNELHD
ncbi:MAG: DedA family protein [Nitrospirae bacterium]|nr:DedA family protein [Nitrospirota bacterium]